MNNRIDKENNNKELLQPYVPVTAFYGGNNCLQDFTFKI